MEKTYSADQLRRMRAAYDTIEALEDLKHYASEHGRFTQVQDVNKLIEHWYATVEAIKSEE